MHVSIAWRFPFYGTLATSADPYLDLHCLLTEKFY